MFGKRSLRRGKAKAKRTGKDHTNPPPGMPQPLDAHFLSLPIYTLICSLLLYKLPDWYVPMSSYTEWTQHMTNHPQSHTQPSPQRDQIPNLMRNRPECEKSAPVMPTTSPALRSNTEYTRQVKNHLKPSPQPLSQ